MLRLMVIKLHNKYFLKTDRENKVAFGASQIEARLPSTEDVTVLDTFSVDYFFDYNGTDFILMRHTTCVRCRHDITLSAFSQRHGI